MARQVARWKDVRRRDHRPAAERADAGFVEDGFFLPDAVSLRGLLAFPLRLRIADGQPGDCAMQSAPVIDRQPIE